MLGTTGREEATRPAQTPIMLQAAWLVAEGREVVERLVGSPPCSPFP